MDPDRAVARLSVACTVITELSPSGFCVFQLCTSAPLLTTKCRPHRVGCSDFQLCARFFSTREHKMSDFEKGLTCGQCPTSAFGFRSEPTRMLRPRSIRMCRHNESSSSTCFQHGDGATITTEQGRQGRSSRSARLGRRDDENSATKTIAMMLDGMTRSNRATE
jgi:hypothetical protein